MDHSSLGSLKYLLKPAAILAALIAVIGVLFVPCALVPWTKIAMFALLFSFFLLPGTVWASCFRQRIDITFLSLAFFISYALYAALAYAIQVANLGFNAFYLGFSGMTIGTVIWGMKKTTRLVRLPIDWKSMTVCLCAVFLSSAYFQFPYLNDQSLFDGNIVSSWYYRNFEPSAVDVMPFGIDIPQPRMRANLYHTFFAVYAHLMHLEPSLLTLHLANPFVGMFLFLSLTSFLWEVMGRRIDAHFCFLAVIFPFCLVYQPSNWAWYSFRFLNGPTLDKDFCLFVVLPMLGISVHSFLLTGERKWIWLLFLAFPAVAFSHPVTATYLVLTVLVLVCGFFCRETFVRALALLTIASGFFFLGNLLVAPADTHQAITRLADYDRAHSRHYHFWTGHYLGHPDTSVRWFRGTDIPYIDPSYIFSSQAISYSAKFTMGWAFIISVMLFWKHRRLGWMSFRHPHVREVLFVVVAAGLSAAAVLLLVPRGLPLKLQTVILATFLAGCGLLLALIPAWRVAGPFLARSKTGVLESENAVSEEELGALRLQIAYLVLLTMVFVGGSLALFWSVHLFRGIERLHWFYFGFFSVAFFFHHVWTAMTRLLSHLVAFPANPFRVFRLTLKAVPGLLLLALCADQTVAYFRQGPSLGKRLGIKAYVDFDGFHDRMATLKTTLSTTTVFLHRDEWPSWLHPEDRVLDLTGTCALDQPFHARQRMVYYRELYPEGHALQYLGDSFLEWFSAYNDLIDGVVTKRSIEFLKKREVTVLIAWDKYPLNETLAALRRVPGLEIQEIAKDVFRVRWWSY